MSKRISTLTKRPTFSEFLRDMATAAFPQTAGSQKGPVRSNCPKYTEQICNSIRAEAYTDTGLRSSSMLQAINQALQTEYQALKEKIRDSFHPKDDSLEAAQTSKHLIQKYEDYFSKVSPSALKSSYAEYEKWVSRFTNPESGNWYDWLGGKKPGRVFDLIQILLYGILHPRFDGKQAETASARNSRIAGFYQKLIIDYLELEPPEKRLLDTHFHFIWENDSLPAVILTEGTLGLLSTVLFFANLLVYSDGADGTWSEEERDLIDQFRRLIIARVNKDNNYISSFYATQSPQVFYAQPYATAFEKEIPQKREYIPPEKLPWDNLGFETPVHMMIQAPAASGKTSLYQAVGSVLTRRMVPPNGCTEKDRLAYQLGLDSDAAWVVIALNAQQFIWYWNNHDNNQCEDFIDMFFRGNLALNKTPDSIIDIIMNTTVPERVAEAHQQRRLILLFDGFDELADLQVRDTFYAGLKKFDKSYPNAHRILFSRPTNRKDMIRLTSLFPQTSHLIPFTAAQVDEFQPLTPELKKRFRYGRYQTIAHAPFMLTLLCKSQSKSMTDTVYDYAKQVITKEYDSAGRIMLLPANLQKQNLQVLTEQLAWNISTNSGSSISQELGRLMHLPSPDPTDTKSIKTNMLDIQQLAQQIGILHYSEEYNDYRFTAPLLQAVLAASYLSRLLKSNANPVMLRSLLQDLPDNIYLDIVFALIHILTQTHPLFAEILMMDFAFRNWSDTHANDAIQDLLYMEQGIYGVTPFQTSRPNTLHRILAAKDTLRALTPQEFPECCT